MQPYSLKTLYTELSSFSKDIALYLPRSSNLKQLANTVDDDTKAVVMHYCTEGASKALCIYYGGFRAGMA